MSDEAYLYWYTLMSGRDNRAIWDNQIERELSTSDCVYSLSSMNSFPDAENSISIVLQFVAQG